MAKKPRKNVKGDGEDQISSLPDDVLIKILCLVPTEQALTTSFLSTRWKSLWTFLPELDLDYISFCKSFNIKYLDQIRKRFHGFLEFAGYVLTHHQLEHLHRLRIAFDITHATRKKYGVKNNYAPEVCRLVRFAMGRNCSTLDLQLSDPRKVCDPTYHGMYNMPPCKSFPHQSVTHLSLTNCKLTVSKYRNFLSVKIVKLTTVELRKDSVYDLVSKCPCLEELHVIHCKFPSSSFELSCPESSLRCLVLKSRHDEDFSHVSVNIPTLWRFKYKGASCCPSINNAENLIEAEIKLDSYRRTELKCLDNLLKDLRNVQVLILCFRCYKKSGEWVQVLPVTTGTNSGTSLLPQLCNLKNLSITVSLVGNELLSLMCLLRNSPYLETLFVDLHEYDDSLRYQCTENIISSVCNEDEVTIPEPHFLPSDCIVHLTKIEINNFQGLKGEMEFVKVMLQSSLSLKEIVICISSRYEYLKESLGEDHDEVLQKKKYAAVESLLACTCVSPDARILIK